MARSLLNNANFLASIAAISRRGFSVASSSVVKKGEEKVVMMMKEGGTESSSSWIPDPVTGFYRPADRVREIDSVELREMLLKNKKAHQH